MVHTSYIAYIAYNRPNMSIRDVLDRHVWSPHDRRRIIQDFLLFFSLFFYPTLLLCTLFSLLRLDNSVVYVQLPNDTKHRSTPIRENAARTYVSQTK